MFFGSAQSDLGKGSSHATQIELFKQLTQLDLPIDAPRHVPSWME